MDGALGMPTLQVWHRQASARLQGLGWERQSCSWVPTRRCRLILRPVLLTPLGYCHIPQHLSGMELEHGSRIPLCRSLSGSAHCASMNSARLPGLLRCSWAVIFSGLRADVRRMCRGLLKAPPSFADSSLATRGSTFPQCQPTWWGPSSG